MGTALSLFLFKITPFLTALAENITADNGNKIDSTNTLDKVVQWGGGIGGAILGLALIISIVKDGLAYAKGDSSGSVLKIVGKVAFLLICIGIIFVAVNWHAIGTTTGGAAASAATAVSDEAGSALGKPKSGSD